MAVSLVLRYAARSDTGKVRAKNDDSAYAGQFLAVVADGMGGHAGGDVASASTTLDLIHLDHSDYASGDAGTQLADEIQTANSLLSEMVSINPKLTGMGTTVTALLLSEGRLQFAHIGDSRAYRLKNGIFEQMSTDHTFVQRLIDEGRVTAEEAESHPHKNVLMRVLGDVDASPELDLTSFEADPGERWLLCSDGLNFVPLEVVEQVFRDTPSLAETADRLIELTLEAGAPDNVSVVVLEVVEDSEPATAPLPVTAERPVAADSAALDACASSSDTSDTKDEAEAASAPDAEDPDAEILEPSTSEEPAPALESAAEAETQAEEPGEDNSSEERERGDYLTAAVIAEELARRPHELAGAAVTAHAEGKIPAITGRPIPRGAAALLTHKPGSAEAGNDEPDNDEYLITGPAKRRPWFSIILAVVLVVLIVAGAWFAYAWTQTRYYVGESNGKVAVFNGVAQTLGPIKLSHVYKETAITVESLPEFSQQRLRQTLPAGTLADADQIVEDLRLGIVSPPDGPTSPSPSPSVSVPPSPTSPSPSPSDVPQALMPELQGLSLPGTGGR
ncbi:protein phosphatase 2C domain-containing protein [Acaricomes phytoseiuli]|uniref:PP2C family protein-serine/threonine phosphatase n=1 Tax=Acaricomes phytoseiuli TaxID=291968 RepID=UPI00037EA712|nr:protein phosphatase 2C domain-containing protein [Acaricomes phytoseiuli]MCW1248687.1 protein phosphatase 2C domain-containing protein [Acaricomes phytoseiuli]